MVTDAKKGSTIPLGHSIEVTRIQLWKDSESKTTKKRLYLDVIDTTDNIKYEGILYCLQEGKWHTAGEREGLGSWVWEYMQERYAEKKEAGGYIWQKFNRTNATIKAIEKSENDRIKEEEFRKNDPLWLNGYKRMETTRYGNEDDECYGTKISWIESPDGRTVSVSQALEEIKRGAAVVLAEKESKIAQAKAEADAKEKAEQAAIAKEQAAWQATKETHLADMESTQVSDWSEVAIAEVVYSDKRHTIKNATFRNAPAKVVITKMIDDHHTLYVPSSKKCYPPSPVGSADYHQQRASKLFL